MKGAIVGDILGSPHEHLPEKDFDFQLINRFIKYTDDTVLTIAVADAAINNLPFNEVLVAYSRKHPNRGYGGVFKKWITKELEDRKPYNSLGNGSAMRVSSISWIYDSLEDVLEGAKRSSEVTHNNPEGIRGAKATAAAIFLARKGASKDEIYHYLQDNFYYDLTRSYEYIYEHAAFDMTCPVSVPEAIICFLESENFEDAIRKAINLGADSDTQAAIAGSIAEAFYRGVPDELWIPCKEKLAPDLLEVTEKFYQEFVLPKFK
jgi:ADP-ribosylglycohydrolase